MYNSPEKTSKHEVWAFKEISTPPVAKPNTYQVFRHDSQLKMIDPNGEESPIGAGSGAGSLTTWLSVKADINKLKGVVNVGSASTIVQSVEKYGEKSSYKTTFNASGDAVVIEKPVTQGAIDSSFNQFELAFKTVLNNLKISILDSSNNSVKYSKNIKIATKWTILKFDSSLVTVAGPNIKIKIESTDGTVGDLYFDAISADSDPRAIGEFVEVNRVNLESNNNNVITGLTKNVVFNGTGTGWNSTNNEYTIQKTGSRTCLNGGININANLAFAIYLAVDDGTGYVNVLQIHTNTDATSFKTFNVNVPKEYCVAGYKVAIRVSINVTLQNVASPVAHFLNISESVNRRTITVEGDSLVSTYAPTVEGFGTPLSISASYFSSGKVLFLSGTMQSGTTQPAEAKWYLPEGVVIDDNLGSNVVIGKVGRSSTSLDCLALATGGNNYIGFYNDATSSSGFTPMNGDTVIAPNEFISFTVAIPVKSATSKETLAITLDEVRANGNEYKIFGKYFYDSDGTKYQQYARAYKVTAVNQSLATGLPTTLVPIGDWSRYSAESRYQKYKGNATNFSNVHYFYAGLNAGDLNMDDGGVLDSIGLTVLFRYYDTARPLN